MTVAVDQNHALTVPVEQLRRACPTLVTDPGLPDPERAATSLLSQERAVEALRFAFQIERDGYNVFVLGPIGNHRHELAEDLARERAAKKDTPPDWCYVNNFANPEKPRALRLPAGRGRGFREDMRNLIEDVRFAIPAAFEDEDYRAQLKALEEQSQQEITAQWRSLKELAENDGITVLQTPSGYVLAPVRDGKVIDDAEFEKLPENERKRIEVAIEHLSDELQTRIERMPGLRKQHHERIRELNQEVTAHTVKALLEEIKSTYRDLPEVVAYLESVQQDIIDNAKAFRDSDGPALPFLAQDPSSVFEAYEVNLVVSNEVGASAPVVYEANPGYTNLVGKVEHRAEMGALVTDYRMIRAGALLRANGGYLLLDAHRVLTRPFVWEALKQSLFAGQVRIESPADTLGFVSTTSLQPEPVPLNVKIIMIGERWLYYLLSRYDTEFAGLFKVAADFDDDVQRSAANVYAIEKLIAERVRTKKLKPFSDTAVRYVVEERARSAGDSERLSTHIQSLDDLLVQADHWARQRSANRVDSEDVSAALQSSNRRLNRVQQRIVDAIHRNTLLIDTSGSCVGQINGLSVIDLGEYRFGHPVRITATTRVGTGDVVDIEREVELGGAIHSKGVMILSSALSARYAPEVPLSLHGSVVFEQSYGGVDGDSASIAELCALLSSISRVPLRQNLACTGSVNQLGRVQAVGGVNEKIEGFYEICERRGLDGSHGVVIPADNVKHLMLRDTVVTAVEAGRFTIYAIEHLDDAIAILTGKQAGQRGPNGDFPEGTVNRLVEDQLIRYARKRREFAESAGHHEEKD
jgi:lon-related putative ATP-dependent protease